MEGDEKGERYHSGVGSEECMGEAPIQQAAHN